MSYFAKCTTPFFILTGVIFLFGSFVPVTNAQSFCGSYLQDDVIITAEQINSEDRTASFNILLESPPFTNSNVNSFSFSSGDNSSEFTNTLEENIEASYDQSTTDIEVTVQVDIDCSGNQGVFKTEDFSFDEEESQTVDPRFSYSVDGENNITATVLSPTDGNHLYDWYVDQEGTSGSPDLSGQNISFAASDYQNGSEVSIEISLGVLDGDGNQVGSISKTIPTLDGRSESDSDGDGVLDSNEEGEDEEDDGNGDEDDGGDDGGGSGSTTGLVNCGNPGADGVLQESEMCDYAALISMIGDIIRWLIGILVMVATLLFMYAGILYLTAGSDSGQVDTAKEIFQNVAGGFLIVLLAFALIATLVNMLTREDWRDNWDQAIPIELSINRDAHNYLS